MQLYTLTYQMPGTPICVESGLTITGLVRFRSYIRAKHGWYITTADAPQTFAAFARDGRQVNVAIPKE